MFRIFYFRLKVPLQKKIGADTLLSIFFQDVLLLCNAPKISDLSIFFA